MSFRDGTENVVTTTTGDNMDPSEPMNDNNDRTLAPFSGEERGNPLLGFHSVFKDMEKFFFEGQEPIRPREENNPGDYMRREAERTNDLFDKFFGPKR